MGAATHTKNEVKKKERIMARRYRVTFVIWFVGKLAFPQKFIMSVFRAGFPIFVSNILTESKIK